MSDLRATIPAKINGKPATFALDSGAFYSMFSGATAAEYGLRASPTLLRVEGVGGSTSVGATTIKEFTLAGASFKNVEFLVGGSEIQGESIGILGQNFLERLDIEYDLATGTIRMFRTEKCEHALLAYWLKPDQSYSSMPIERIEPLHPHTSGVAYVNGQQVRVIFDTGAPTSMLSLKAAERAGVKPDSPGVMSVGFTGGLGRGTVRTYVAPFASLKIGDGEEIKNVKLLIVDMDLRPTEMLLGADFFVSHRIFVANREHKVFLSYNGGPVFSLSQRAAPASASPSGTGVAGPKDAPSAGDGAVDSAAATANDAAAAGSAAVPPASTAPADAADLARRGSALAARRDFQPALADLSKAIELSPMEPEYYYQRANAYLAAGQADPALLDYDHVISLKQDFLPAYLPRAELKLARKDRAGAILDLDTVDRLASKQADLRLAAAEFDHRIERLPEAIEQYTLWIQNHPDDSRLPRALAGRCSSSALLDQNLAVAMNDCNTALRRTDKSDTGYPHVLADRGLLRLRQGDYAKAIADFDDALALMPKNAGVMYARGVAESRLQKTSQSKTDLEAALQIAPKIGEHFERFGILP